MPLACYIAGAVSLAAYVYACIFLATRIVSPEHRAKRIAEHRRRRSF